MIASATSRSNRYSRCSFSSRTTIGRPLRAVRSKRSGEDLGLLAPAVIAVEHRLAVLFDLELEAEKCVAIGRSSSIIFFILGETKNRAILSRKIQSTRRGGHSVKNRRRCELVFGQPLTTLDGICRQETAFGIEPIGGPGNEERVSAQSHRIAHDRYLSDPISRHFHRRPETEEVVRNVPALRQQFKLRARLVKIGSIRPSVGKAFHSDRECPLLVE